MYIDIFKELKAKPESTKHELEIRWHIEAINAKNKKDKKRMILLMKIKGIIRKQTLIDDILKKKFPNKKKLTKILNKRFKKEQKGKKEKKDWQGIKPESDKAKPAENVEDIKEDIMRRAGEILTKEMYEGEEKAKKEFEEEMRIYREYLKAKNAWDFYHAQLKVHESKKNKELKKIKEENKKRKKTNNDRFKKWESQYKNKENELKKEEETYEKKIKEEQKKFESKLERQIIKKYQKDLKSWGKKTPWYKKLFWINQPKIENYLNDKNSVTELFIAEVEKDERLWFKKLLEGNKFRKLVFKFRPGIKGEHKKKIENLRKELESLKNKKPRPLKLIPAVYKKNLPVKPCVEEPLEDIKPPEEKRRYRVGIKEIVAVISHTKKALVTIDCPAHKGKTNVRIYSETELKKGIDTICDNCKKRIIITSTNIF